MTLKQQAPNESSLRDLEIYNPGTLPCQVSVAYNLTTASEIFHKDVNNAAFTNSTPLPFPAAVALGHILLRNLTAESSLGPELPTGPQNIKPPERELSTRSQRLHRRKRHQGILADPVAYATAASSEQILAVVSRSLYCRHAWT